MVEYDPFPKIHLVLRIDFRALCGERLVTYPPELWRSESFVVHRVEAVSVSVGHIENRT